MDLDYASHPNLTRAHQLVVDAIHTVNPRADQGAMVSVHDVYHACEADLWDSGDSWLTFERCCWDLARASIVAATEYGASEPCETRTLSDPEGRLNFRGEVRQYHTLSLR